MWKPLLKWGIFDLKYFILPQMMISQIAW